MNTRNDVTSALNTGFEILDVERKGTTLNVELSGGCDVSDYNVIWDGKIMESHRSG